MVICFFPGAGGHRYKLYTQGLPFDKTGTHMHNYEIAFNSGGDSAYLNNDFPISQISKEHLVTTHTMTTRLIREKLPGHKITKIFCDQKKSLRRCWEVSIKNSYQGLDLIEQIDGMFHVIKFSKEYYSVWPIDWEADELVDIDRGDSAYCEVMRKELDITNPYFDFAWDVYEKYGADARILDIAKREYNIK